MEARKAKYESDKAELLQSWEVFKDTTKKDLTATFRQWQEMRRQLLEGPRKGKAPQRIKLALRSAVLRSRIVTFWYERRQWNVVRKIYRDVTRTKQVEHYQPTYSMLQNKYCGVMDSSALLETETDLEEEPSR